MGSVEPMEPTLTRSLLTELSSSVHRIFEAITRQNISEKMPNCLICDNLPPLFLLPPFTHQNSCQNRYDFVVFSDETL